MEEKQNDNIYDKSIESLRLEVAQLRDEVARLNRNLRQIEDILGLKRKDQSADAPSAPFRQQPQREDQPQAPSRPRPSVIPQMREARRQRQNRGRVVSFEEMNVGKYGSAILAGVCILIGCLLLTGAAWSMEQPWLQAAVLLVIGTGAAAAGWLRIRRGHATAVASTLAACGLGILYINFISLHFLWHILPLEAVLLWVALWTAAVFYMAWAGRALFFFYMIHLSDLAAALMAASALRAGRGTAAGAVLLLFPAAIYAITVILTRRLRGYEDAALKKLGNIAAVNGLAIYAVLFLNTGGSLSLFFALAAGGLLLFFWPALYRGPASGEAAGILILQWEVVCVYLLGESGFHRVPAIFLAAAVMILLLLPLIRSRHRDLTAAWSLWPLMLTAAQLSCRLSGEFYPAVYGLLAIYYVPLLLRPKRCRIISFTVACVWMYMVLLASILSGERVLAHVTFGLALLFALAVPVKYVLAVRRDQTAFSSGRRFRFGLAMAAAYLLCVTWSPCVSDLVSLLLEAVMTAVFTGITLWLEQKGAKVDRIFFRGMILLWIFSRIVTLRCSPLGFLPALASVLLFCLNGSLAAWHIFRRKYDISGENPGGNARQYTALAMSSVSLWRLIRTLPIPYSILASLLMLLFALGLLLLGFRADRKEIRSYALFLTFLCVIKMVTADLAGADMLFRSAALAAGGILCLLISFLYTKAEKSRREREQTDFSEKHSS